MNTYCPECNALLIERFGLHTYLKEDLNTDGTCAKCGHQTNINEIKPIEEKVAL